MDDSDKTTVPRRKYISSNADDITMPGKRDRKPDGRFTVGDLIMNRYKVLAELGQGGMGIVYKCFDEIAGIEVALKALPPELSHNTLEMEDIKDNFQLVSRLVHQNIAISKNLERDDSNGNYYLIMECCAGEDLRSWIKRKRKDGNLTLKDVLPIIKQIADALDYAHKQKIIHRDIKPGNIMINAAGEIKVLDFGLAAQIHTSISKLSMKNHGTSGTGSYMAPEQWRGRTQGAPADQYALAVMTYEMLAGHLPFENTNASVLKEVVLYENPEDIADIPKFVQDAIKRAMDKEPAERFASCSDFAAALNLKKIKTFSLLHNNWTPVLLVILLLMAGTAGYFSAQYFKSDSTHTAIPVTTSIPVSKTIPAPPPPPQPRPVSVPIPDSKPVQTRKNDKMKEKNYLLFAALQEKLIKIKKANYDRGQQFSKYLDDLKKSFGAARRAEDKGDFTTATKFYKAAEKAADWIINNAKLRLKVQKLIKKVMTQKKEADKFNSSQLVHTLYKSANAKLIQGSKDYENGNFVSAHSAMSSALAKFNKTFIEARDLMIKKHITSSRNAKRLRQWQIMRDEAVAALKIDKSNREAENLRIEAENELKPSLEIIALVNEKRVPAQVKFGNLEYSTISTIRNLSENRKYNGYLTYHTGNIEYIGHIEFTCDWKSLKKIKASLKEQDFTLIDCDGIPLEMVKIKAGTFLREDEKTVILTKNYWLGKFEVTQAQYKAIMGKNPSKIKGENRPVEEVSWYDAKAFCDKLNKRYFRKLPAGYQFNLPTEAQWEYACRAGTTTNYSYGNASDTTKMNFDGNHPYGGGSKGIYRQQTVEVGTLKYKNAFDLYDMHGNVWEWCRDYWSSLYTNDTTDPTGPLSGSLRVVRGGCWFSIAKLCRSAYRFNYAPGVFGSHIGFRLALVPIH